MVERRHLIENCCFLWRFERLNAEVVSRNQFLYSIVWLDRILTRSAKANLKEAKAVPCSPLPGYQADARDARLLNFLEIREKRALVHRHQ